LLIYLPGKEFSIPQACSEKEKKKQRKKKTKKKTQRKTSSARRQKTGAL